MDGFYVRYRYSMNRMKQRKIRVRGAGAHEFIPDKAGCGRTIRACGKCLIKKQLSKKA